MANICVRPSGDVTFDGDGTTWAAAASGGAVGARKGLPSALTRGNTYYCADGTHATYTFDDAASGTTLITIKKATVADHGTSTGWSDTMGDGTATFGALNFSTDYYVLDGATRNESDWTSQVYGFRIPYIEMRQVNFPPGADHIVIQYCDIGGTVGTSYGDPGFGGDLIIYVRDTSNGTDLTVSRCFIHNGEVMLLVGIDGTTTEYCYFKDMADKEAIRGFDQCKNGIIRYCWFYNTTQNQGGVGDEGTAPIGIWDSAAAGDFDNWEIYGNVFFDNLGTEHSAGAILIGGNNGAVDGVPAANVKIYNNTIVGFTGNLAADIVVNGGSGGTNLEVRNTLWYNCIGTPDAEPNTSNNGESATDIFVNVSTGNVRLSTNSAAGTTLSAPYNTDMDGVTRGTGGNWSRGAFQYVAGGGGAGTLNTTNLNATTLTLSA